MRWKLTHIYGMDIGENVRISRKAELDYSRNPRGIHIGDNTSVTGYVIVLTHDQLNGRLEDVYIGSNCFIGTGSIILPGVRIGDHVVIGAGSVVSKDIPSHCVAVGNPARIIRKDISLSNDSHFINHGERV